MAEEKNNVVEDDDEEELDVVELTDEETGETFLYVQEMVIPVNGNNYALLVPYYDEEDDAGRHEHEHGETCDCCGDEEGDAFFAKIAVNEEGEESYEVLTDEEFEAAMAAYEKLMDEAEAEEKKNG